MTTLHRDLLKLEASKTYATRGRVVVLTIFVVLAAAFMLITSRVEEGPTALQVLTPGFAVLGFALPIVAILIFAQDWQSGGMHFTVTRFPRRSTIWLAKLVVVLALVLVSVVLATLLAVALSPTQGLDWAAAGWGVLPILANTLLATALACLVLRTWLSVLAFVLISSVLGPVVGLLVRDSASFAQRVQYDRLVADVGQGAATTTDLFSLTLWVAIPLVAGYFSFKVRAVD